MQQLAPNILLQGEKYRIKKVLGQGGFGITYLGRQAGLERNVAIKEFFMKQYCDRDNISRVSYSTEANKEVVSKCKDKFLKEARMIASLEHPNIVKVYDIFEENNTAYYVMEYIDGFSLDKLMVKGAIPESTAVNYISQVGQALEYIHSRNILHLDVKPANMLLRKNGSIVLIDFGISKHYDSNGSQTSTMQGAMSKGYAPLEQGDCLMQNFTAATDVYSLGASLMALITGQTPPDASRIMNYGMPTRPSNISNQTWDAIGKAMQPRRKDRTQTVTEFIANLGEGIELDDCKKDVDGSTAAQYDNIQEREDEETFVNLEVESASADLEATAIINNGSESERNIGSNADQTGAILYQQANDIINTCREGFDYCVKIEVLPNDALSSVEGCKSIIANKERIIKEQKRIDADKKFHEEWDAKKKNASSTSSSQAKTNTKKSNDFEGTPFSWLDDISNSWIKWIAAILIIGSFFLWKSHFFEKRTKENLKEYRIPESAKHVLRKIPTKEFILY